MSNVINLFGRAEFARAFAAVPLASTLELHNARIARLREQGRTIMSYRCPCCDQVIEHLQPEPRGEAGGSAICPHCNGLHHYTVYGSGSSVAWRLP